MQCSYMKLKFDRKPQVKNKKFDLDMSENSSFTMTGQACVTFDLLIGSQTELVPIYNNSECVNLSEPTIHYIKIYLVADID